MKVTIKDVAERAGISVTTVSLVLNGRPSRIREETKEAVRKAAEELGYVPSQVALGLKTKRSHTIGLIVSDIRNTFYSSLAIGIEAECRRNGWNVMLCNSGDHADREEEYIRVLDNKGADGIILGMTSAGGQKHAEKEAEYLASTGMPFVLLDRTVISEHSNAVIADHTLGGYLATKYLLECGHSRIACVTGSDYLEGSKSRLEGYKRALREYGVAYDDSLVVRGDYNYEGAFAAVEALAGKDFTALFAFNDMMTYAAVNALKKQGRTVPEDVSVIGYDDSFIAEIHDVPLTMIRQPLYRMGEAAARMLIDIIDGRRAQPATEEFIPELIIRNSVRDIHEA